MDRARDRRDAAARAFALLAVLGAGSYVVALLVLHMLRPEIDPATDAASAYATGDQAWLMTVALVCQGVAGLALATALRHGLVAPARTAAGVTLLAAYGVAQLVAAVTPLELEGAPTTAAGTVHTVAAEVAFVALPLAAVVVARAAGRDPIWRTRRTLLLAATTGLVVAMGATVVAGSSDLDGAAQRLFLGLGALWVITAASQLRATTDARAIEADALLVHA